MSVADYAIATKDLTKGYGRHVTAVHRLNLSVRRGEVYGLLGPSGAGKTSTLRMLLGWSTPPPAPRSCRAERRAIPRASSVWAMVEEPVFYPYLSGVENPRVMARYAGLSEDGIDATLDEVGSPGEELRVSPRRERIAAPPCPGTD